METKKTLVCCRDCKFLKLEDIGQLDQNYISYHKLEKHRMIEVPSGTCSTKIQMCQHPDCFSKSFQAIMGIPAWSNIRIQGQAQLNPSGKCSLYKRIWYKLWKTKNILMEKR